MIVRAYVPGRLDAAPLSIHEVYKRHSRSLSLSEPMKIHLKLYGVFRSAAEASQLDLDIDGKNPTVKSVLALLASQERFQGLKRLLMSDVTSDPRSNALIMISGREIGTLNGLMTTLGENDELTFLPIAHGG